MRKKSLGTLALKNGDMTYFVIFPDLQERYRGTLFFNGFLFVKFFSEVSIFIKPKNLWIIAQSCQSTSQKEANFNYTNKKESQKPSLKNPFNFDKSIKFKFC